MNFIILISYLIFTFLVGWVIIKKWFDGLPTLLEIVGGFLLGTAIAVPITYFLSGLFVKSDAPILWGTLAASTLFIVYCLLFFKKPPSFLVRLNELLFVIVAIAFSTWMMMKTFHGGPSGELFVGSNNVFDFGHSLGIIRSFSWGSNIPFMSPFQSGLPFFYHFFFNFWTAIWEYFGVPIVWAMNIPSILSFTALLTLIYFLPQIVAKQKPIVGWIAVLLTITNSSLTFWKLLMQKTDFWHLPTYPFAGPFDGSPISLFVTLNSYVNQRHLAFAMALALFLFLVIVQDVSKNRLTIRRSLGLGALVGVLLLWNMMTYLFIIGTIALLGIKQKLWKPLVAFVVAAGVVGFISLLPIAGYLSKAFSLFGGAMVSGWGQTVPTWNIAGYLWQNLGLLPVIAVLGYVVIPKKIKSYFFPFIVLFVAECIFAAIGKRGFEQKSFSFLIIGVNVLASVGLVWLWQRNKFMVKIGAVLLLFILTVSGFVDLMPIKNEFAYPLVSKETAPLISWIRSETPKDAVFVSYSDMIDPVVLGGRKNFFGFFGNVGWYDRSGDVAAIYAGDRARAQANNVSYILVPKTKRDDFHYVVDEALLRNTLKQVYEDDLHVVFAVR
ncbi:MAG: hypothetical protein AAB481_04825 [Patescibacteria group bacterium]